MKRILPTCVIGLLVLAVCGAARGADVAAAWDAGDGWWSAATNWDPQVVPDNNGDSYDVTIDTPGAVVRLDVSPTVDSLVNRNELCLHSQALTLATPAGLTNYGTVWANGAASIVGDVSNAPGAQVTVPANNALHGMGTWTNNGEVSATADGSYHAYPAWLVASSDLTLTGTGRLHLVSPRGSAYVQSTGTAVMTNGAGHTMDGYGYIEATLVNAGTIDANVSGKTLVLSGPSTTTGTLNVVSGAALQLGGGAVHDLAFGSAVTGPGILRLDDGTLRLAGASAGAVAVEGSYVQTASSKLEIGIAGPSAGGQFGQLNVGGQATLAGTLAVGAIGGFVPAAGQTYQVLTCAGRAGGFAVLEGRHIEAGRYFEVVYGPQDVTLSVRQAHEGDADLDEKVDVYDLAALANEYGWTAGGSAIPEPLAAAMLGLGGAALLRRRRRRA